MTGKTIITNLRHRTNKLNHKGFGVVQVLLLLTIFGLISGVGWFVWKTNNTQNSSEITSNQSQTSDQAYTKPDTEVQEIKKAETTKVESPKLGFTIDVPNSWSHRLCGDIDAVVFLDPGSDGAMQCLVSDATWPEDDWYKYGKVVIGVGDNPFPRPGDLYDKDAEQISLGNNKAKKFTYQLTIDKDKGGQITVTEYVIKGDTKTVTAKVFTGSVIDEQYPKIDATELVTQLEKALASIQIK